MEVLWFLKQRTTFIRRHYQIAEAPFRDIIRKIEANEEPYEASYSEDGEPAFLEEWIEANTSLEILGATCVSMLSEALKLYFLTWERQIGIECQKHFRSTFKEMGFVNGYKTCFGCLIETDWSNCPADFALIEQIVLARNDSQHHKEITDIRLRHSGKTREKHPLPFFLSDQEKRLIGTEEYQEYPWSGLSLVVTQDNLFEAIRQVELLGEWIERPLFEVKYRRR